MNGWLKKIAAGMVMVGAVSATASFGENVATAPAAQKAVDRSSPEKTWAGVCAALKSGDLAGFRAAFYNGSELSRLFMETYSDVTVATFDLARATTLLGEPGKQLGKKFEGVYTETVKNGENRKAEIAGDKAKWVHAVKPAKGVVDDAIFFRRVKGEWLIDTVETYELDTDAGRDAAEKLIDSVPKVTALLKQVAVDIRARKITTVEQMRQRLAAAK